MMRNRIACPSVLALSAIAYSNCNAAAISGVCVIPVSLQVYRYRVKCPVFGLFLASSPSLARPGPSLTLP